MPYLFFNTIFTIFTGTIPYDVVLLKKKKEIFKPETSHWQEKRSTPLCHAIIYFTQNLFFQAEIFKNDKLLLLHYSHIQKGQINKISFVN